MYDIKKAGGEDQPAVIIYNGSNHYNGISFANEEVDVGQKSKDFCEEKNCD